MNEFTSTRTESIPTPPGVLEGLDAWRDLPIRQQPQWGDATKVASVSGELASLPPLVFAGEVDRLRDDPRVVVREGLNIRDLVLADVEGEPVDLVVADVSFISLTHILPALVPLLPPEGQLLMLVKPQFELQPGQVGKGGIVRDPALYAVVEARLRQCCAEVELEVLDWFDSVLEGGDGNREFFIYAKKVA